jgi:nucleoside-diphosphate-sugar epimerase
VDDAAEAQIAALEAPADKVRSEIFNVVQDNYQIRDLAMQVAAAVEATNTSVAISTAPEPALVRNYRCANDKLFEVLGFRPSRSVAQCVVEMVRAFGEMDAAKFAHPRYYNLEWLVLLMEARAGLQPFDYVLRHGEGSMVSE